MSWRSWRSVIVAAKKLGPPISAESVENVRAKWGDGPAAAFARIAAEWREAVDRGDAVATLRAERRTAHVLNVLLLACIQAVPEEVAL